MPRGSSLGRTDVLIVEAAIEARDAGVTGVAASSATSDVLGHRVSIELTATEFDGGRERRALTRVDLQRRRI